MDKVFIGYVLGCLVLGITFWTLGFTPGVTFEQGKQAQEVCKQGQWEHIDLHNILCKDGATYKLNKGKN